MAKLCWDNAVLVSPALAKELGIEARREEEHVQGRHGGVTVDGRS